MIRIIMFDLGNTLIRESDRTPFPHVLSALGVLRNFVDDTGTAVPLCLVSNFPQQLPVPDRDLPQVFAEFLEILNAASLTEFFQPVDQRVTLSAHAGVAKPKPACFAKALERAGLNANLESCLFITEDQEHVARARDLGMRALRFGGHQIPSDPGSDFSDWAEGPLVIARSAFPGNAANLKLAVAGFLQATRGLSVLSVDARDGEFEVQANTHARLPAHAPESLRGVMVDVPVTVRMQITDEGHVAHVDGEVPKPEVVAEAALGVEALHSNGQIAGAGESPLGATHRIEVTPSGERVLRRKRYSAF
ncbi:MAG TPA: hypothetical protein VHR66_06655 [Gemmataceae bacterium]|jgi:hypothetical protein|nr:hypothetical protein [Gemmataceae bacterium]